MKKIGPRLYYMHNKQGGVGWMLKQDNYNWYLELEDPKLMTMLLLSIGDNL